MFECQPVTEWRFEDLSLKQQKAVKRLRQKYPWFGRVAFFSFCVSLLVFFFLRGSGQTIIGSSLVCLVIIVASLLTVAELFKPTHPGNFPNCLPKRLLWGVIYQGRASDLICLIDKDTGMCKKYGAGELVIFKSDCKVKPLVVVIKNYQSSISEMMEMKGGDYDRDIKSICNNQLFYISATFLVKMEIIFKENNFLSDQEFINSLNKIGYFKEASGATLGGYALDCARKIIDSAIKNLYKARIDSLLKIEDQTVYEIEDEVRQIFHGIKPIEVDLRELDFPNFNILSNFICKGVSVLLKISISY